MRDDSGYIEHKKRYKLAHWRKLMEKVTAPAPEDFDMRKVDEAMAGDPLSDAVGHFQSRIDKLAPLTVEGVQLCRQMCSAVGHDPDTLVVDTTQKPDGPMGSYIATRSVPAWALFREAAVAVTGDVT